MIVSFFTKLIHKLFICIHLLRFSTCFEPYYAHLQEEIVSGIVTLLKEVTIVINVLK